jgi:hypothetical protein
VSSWLPVNFAVILLAIAAVAVFYTISRLLPASTSSKMASLVRSEIVQIVLSVILIAVLVASSGLACQITSTAFAAPSTGQDPMSFAQGYMLQLVGNDGIGLLTNLYSFHFAYAVISAVFSRFGEFIGAWLPSAAPGKTLNISFPLGYDLGIAYGYLSGTYLDIFAPIVMVATALMYVQYILLVLFQASAFTLLVPVALIMRMIPFGGAKLRNAANSILAIAIAGYIVYPLTIAFNSYATQWIFTNCAGVPVAQQGISCNPSAGYADSLLCYNSGTITSCTAGPSITQGALNVPGLSQNFLGYSTPSPYGVLSGGVGAQFWKDINPNNAVQDIHGVVDRLAIFMFVTFILSTLSFAITLSFAMGLTKALDGGVDAAASFWSSM